MADNFAEGPGIPTPPFEVPIPDLPEFDLLSAGKQMADGAASAESLKGFWDFLLKFIVTVVGRVMSVIMHLFGYVAVFVARTFLAAREDSDDVLAEASSAAVADLFGIESNSQWFKALQNREARAPVAKSAAEAVLTALVGDVNATGGSELAPSSERAEKYLTTVTHLAIEGWLEGWIMEALSAGQLETFAELKDIMANALGLGRMTRRVLAAPLKILVEDPFTWKLNLGYRPALLPTSTAIRQYLRGRMDATALDQELGRIGYNATRREALINENSLHLSPSQVSQLKYQGSFTQDQAVQLLADQGYDKTTAEYVLVIEEQTRARSYDLEIARLAIEQWAAGNLDVTQKDRYLQSPFLNSTDTNYLNALGELKLLYKRKRFTVSEAKTLVEKGLWDITQFRDLLDYIGYDSDDARDLELLTFAEIKDASDAAAKKAAAAKAAADKAAAAAAAAKAKAAAAAAELATKGITTAKFETLVKDGIRTLDDYKAYLLAKGVPLANVTVLVQSLQQDIAKQEAAASKTPGLAAAAAAKNLSLSQLDKSVRAGLLSMAEYTQRLLQTGFAAADVQILADLAQQDIDAAAAKAKAKVDAAATAAEKHLDLAQEERAVRLGLKTIDDYVDYLATNGFAEEDAAILVAEMKAQLATDQAAQATRKAAAAAAQTKGLSLPQLEQAVRAGVKTLDDYRAALVQLGYDAAAQDTLVSLLTLNMETDQQALAAQGKAAAILGQRGVSLSDLARAVKLGVVDISVYTDALARAGLSLDDQQLLTLTLAAQTAATKKAATPTAAADSALKASGLSVAKLEAAVLAGTSTVDQFAAQLAAAGVDQAAVLALVSVLNDELANKMAVDAKTAEVSAKAAAKGLSLSQEQAAVRAGVKTLDDYYSFVMALGFDLADADTLTATLAAQLNKAAAASTGSSGSPTADTAPVV